MGDALLPFPLTERSVHLCVDMQRIFSAEGRGRRPGWKECCRSSPNVYVEARPKGRPEGSAIDDYVVEDHADTCSRPSKHNRRQSRGLKRTIIHL